MLMNEIKVYTFTENIKTTFICSLIVLVVEYYGCSLVWSLNNTVTVLDCYFLSNTQKQIYCTHFYLIILLLVIVYCIIYSN